MLLSFSFKGFKSFKEEACLDLRPSMVRDLKYSLLNDEYNSKEAKALSCAVVYGPNSAGKTNILKALNFFKNIVTSRTVDSIKDSFLATNIHLEKPVISFSISFIHNSTLFDYSVSLTLKSVLTLGAETDNKVLDEKLSVNNKPIFERNEEKVMVNEKNAADFVNIVSKDFDINKMASQIFQKNTLFISSGFKEYLSISLYNNFINWFEDYLVVFDNPSSVFIQINESDDKSKINKLNNFSSSIINTVTDTDHMVRYSKVNGKDNFVPYSEINSNDKRIGVPSSAFESRGSNRLLNILPIVGQTLAMGGVLAIDEADTSVHPTIISNIIGIFHNPKINTNNAQLIITTHNPLYLQKSILRRDEIYFVENEKGEGSELYSLSDFKTSGPGSVRNTSDYISNYFINKYGGIKYVDLSDAVTKFIKDIKSDSK